MRDRTSARCSRSTSTRYAIPHAGRFSRQYRETTPGKARSPLNPENLPVSHFMPAEPWGTRRNQRPCSESICMQPQEPTSTDLNEMLPGGSVASAARALPAGASLDDFQVEDIIVEGSVAIVYAARDRALATTVAIAEYMPASLAQRDDGGRVTPRTSAQAGVFADGLKAFIHDSRTLARCDHPSLVRVVRQWEANATAYRVMPRYEGRRLLDVRQNMSEPPDEASLRSLLDALLSALQVLNDAGGVHGKVTPSNILLLEDNRLVLLGPGGAARAIAGDLIDMLKASGEPCFAPLEQIVEAESPLPPSADLYALAGVARYCISGELPAPFFGAPGTARHEKLADTVQRLRQTWPQLHYSASLLAALDNALSIYPAQRPQHVAEMRMRMDTALPAAARPVSAPETVATGLNDTAPSSSILASESTPVRVAQDLDAALPVAPNPDPMASSDVARTEDPVLTTFAREVTKSRRIAMWSGGMLALVALLLIGAYQFRQEPQVVRVLDELGLGGTGTEKSATVSVSSKGPAAPVTPPMTADAGAAKSTSTEPTAANAPTSAATPASPVSAPVATDAGTAKSIPTGPTVANVPAGAAAPASSAGASVAADGGAAKSTPTESTAANAPPGVTAPAPSARVAPATPVASAAENPSTVAPTNSTSPPTRVAQQQTARAPTSPRDVCGARTQFSLYRCMQTQCGQKRWASHPQCEHLRATDSVD